METGKDEGRKRVRVITSNASSSKAVYAFGTKIPSVRHRVKNSHEGTIGSKAKKKVIRNSSEQVIATKRRTLEKSEPPDVDYSARCEELELENKNLKKQLQDLRDRLQGAETKNQSQTKISDESIPTKHKSISYQLKLVENSIQELQHLEKDLLLI